MISRYEVREVSEIWSEESKFRCYLEVELAILKTLEGEYVPKGLSEKIKANAKISPKRIQEIEATVHHDVIAFCTSITENLTPNEGKFFHFGVTSSDIIDTATTLQIKKSLELVISELETLCMDLYGFAKKYRELVCMGRSHAMFAEPMSFGQKFLGHYCEFSRRLEELRHFYKNELTGQFSGAVGNYTVLRPEQEKKALMSLGLSVEDVPTQVIPRDRTAKLISISSLIASAVERLAVEIRHLHRSEVAEVFEGFSKGQKGSSTMPHKKNPISGENLTGMARFLRSHLSIALENIVLWHERDISHSSNERLYLPDHFGILVYSLRRLSKTINNLVVQETKIESRVFDNFIYLSSFFLHHLISNTNRRREDLYEIVQASSFNAKTAKEFHQGIVELLAKDNIDLSSPLPFPSEEEIRLIYLKSSQEVFRRVEERFSSDNI
jgi:adenylosuccinate lyase